MEVINIYCDESCHLENDSQRYIALGALWCPINEKKEILERIKEIKIQNKLASDFEIKWHKVSKSKVAFYLELIDYFFDNDNLHFRSLIIDKTQLKHSEFNQTHDDFYYKMYFDLLKVIISPNYSHNIYLDIKDTQGATKVEKLGDILSNNNYDFSRKIIKRVQEVRSEQVSLLQLSDLLLGAVSYENRGLNTNQGKIEVIERIKKRSKYSLTRTTLPTEEKFNIFKWQSKK